ncbi:DUF397 domain-containing protein [Streptomyces sp. CAU 1734]|uniref:DUF397 domain-containing protein n=1 Tax=Streptomyces sp. CAU 1734 TaxID=3140360 RepID=UPI003261C496
MNTEQATELDATLKWFKSSYSGSGGGDCVEVAANAGTIHIRDSKARDGGMVTLSSRSWAAFLTHAGMHRTG